MVLDNYVDGDFYELGGGSANILRRQLLVKKIRDCTFGNYLL
jgi:hypothetical protein